MSRASKSKLSFGWLVVGLNLFCLAFLIFLIWYGYRESLAIKNDHQKLNDARVEAVERKRWEDLLRATAAERIALHASIVSEDRLPAVIGDLEHLGDQTGAEVEISNVALGDNSNANFKLALTASGTYRELIQLASLVENLPYQLKIMRSDFHRSDVTEEKTGKKGPPGWQARFDLELLQPKAI